MWSRRIESDVRTVGAVVIFLGGLALVLSEGPSSKTPADRLLNKYMPRATTELSELVQCQSAAQSDTVHSVAMAIVAEETAIHHPIEGLYETPLIWLGRTLNFDPPNLSLGPAQISPRHYMKLNNSLEGYWATVSSNCASMQWTERWVAMNATDGAQTPQDREELFAKWSGHLKSAASQFETAAYFSFSEQLFWRAKRRIEFAHQDAK